MTPVKDPDDYWFPAKRFGWGWGAPKRPQGWAVLIAYAVAMALIAMFLPPTTDIVGFLAGTALASALLVAICWWKGEPPRWRW